MSILTSAPAERNKGPITDVLQRVLPGTGDVLEIASGSGQHVEAFAHAARPGTLKVLLDVADPG